MSDSVRPHRQQPTRLLRPWDSPGKNTGVGCHFLLQCMQVKSESEVAQSCPTLRDPMDCSPPDSSVHGIFQVRVLEWVAIAFSELTLGSIKQQELSKRKPVKYKTWHHPTTSNALCRTPHLNNKQNKNTNKNTKTRLPPHSVLPIRGKQRNNNNKLSTNLTLQEAQANHWTNVRSTETKRKKEFNFLQGKN